MAGGCPPVHLGIELFSLSHDRPAIPTRENESFNVQKNSGLNLKQAYRLPPQSAQTAPCRVSFVPDTSWVGRRWVVAKFKPAAPGLSLPDQRRLPRPFKAPPASVCPPRSRTPRLPTVC